jgi:chitin synthase
MQQDTPLLREDKKPPADHPAIPRGGHRVLHFDVLRDHLAGSHPDLLAGADEVRDATPLDAFCVTLYNEEWPELRQTIESVIVASERARASQANRFVICIVADGVDHLSASTRAGLENSGLLTESALRFQHSAVHVSEHRTRDLLARLATPPDPTIPAGPVHFIVFLKDENRGKLDSHRIFFESICDRLSPRYCYQLDAGSTFAPDAVGRLLGTLASEPQLAGLAPRVTPPVPAASTSILESWQYYDFAYRQAVLLPVESALDLLGVMPGQACVFRWNALRHKRTPTTGTDPVSAYLYGIASGSPLRPLLYLSEDRVIGGAILLDPVDDWRLRFVPESVAYTDACADFGQLLRQRRRWTNSAMLCRLWLSTKWSQLFGLRNRSAGVKTRQSLSIAFELLVGFLEFTAPAQLVAFALVLGNIGAASANGGALVGAFLACLVVEIALRCTGHFASRPGLSRALASAATGASWMSVAFLVAALAYGLPGPPLFLVLGHLLLALGCMALLLPLRGLPSLMRMRLSPLVSSSMFSATLGYALWNMRDTSWGTRGLVADTRSHATRRSLENFRWYVLGTWVLVNGLIVLAALRPGMISGLLNPVIETTSVLELGVAGAALSWILARWTKRKLLEKAAD